MLREENPNAENNNDTGDCQSKNTFAGNEPHQKTSGGLRPCFNGQRRAVHQLFRSDGVLHKKYKSPKCKNGSARSIFKTRRAAIVKKYSQKPLYQGFQQKNCTPFKIRIVSNQVCSYGGEGETRTPAPVSRPTPLAGAPRHQLEYFSIWSTSSHVIQLFISKQDNWLFRWRREWDSNPRYVSIRRFSRPFRYNHFGISPHAQVCYHITHGLSSLFRPFFRSRLTA